MIESLRPSHEAPFRGLRVLDFGQGVASPYAGYLLATNGADVIKVEPPEGDWSRRLGTVYGNQSALSAVYNRGKRSLRSTSRSQRRSRPQRNWRRPPTCSSKDSVRA
jgi:crotonobetainyl-CoA:carnitine CoA-transferase CaiB-like acyl-CoA transferase